MASRLASSRIFFSHTFSQQIKRCAGIRGGWELFSASPNISWQNRKWYLGVVKKRVNIKGGGDWRRQQ